MSPADASELRRICADSSIGEGSIGTAATVGHMARRPRNALPKAGIYHVTARGVARMPLFLDDDDRIDYLSLLSGVAARWNWTLHVLCLMPNHVHQVIETSLEALSKGVHRLHGQYAEGFNTKYARWGHVFGDRFASWIPNDEEHLRATCRYVLLNPVRAGLVAEPREWPWSRSRYGWES
jgi:putative transposase